MIDRSFGGGMPAAFTLTESLVASNGVFYASYKRAGEVKTASTRTARRTGALGSRTSSANGPGGAGVNRTPSWPLLW